LKGELVLRLKHLHDQYGPVVRIAPDELSFIDSEAWKSIYGGHGDAQLPRDIYIFPPEIPELKGGLIYADNRQHPRIRKQLSYAFSQRALDEQVPLIQLHIDTLIAQLRKQAISGEPVNLADWFNFASFDIMGHLAYGEDFRCLETGEYHPYAAFVLEAFEGGLFASALNRYGLLPFAMLLMPAEMARKRNEFIAMGVELTRERIAIEKPSEHQKHDFFSYMLSTENPEKSMNFGEMATNAAVFMIAGSESTATLLSGTILALLKNPAKMQKVTKEIRDAFETEEQITIVSSSKLSYMLACLEEGLRMTVPAPFGIARKTTTPTMIAGVVIPPGTSVSVGQYAAWHSSHNFTRPDEYIPERWREEKDEKSEFKNDNRAGFFPFSMGPRNCIGKKWVTGEVHKKNGRYTDL
jgi:cytochrome P450